MHPIPFTSPYLALNGANKLYQTSMAASWSASDATHSVHPRQNIAFSGMEQRAYHILEPIFRATSDFIWDLMIVDTIAIWVPRIFNAMNRGSVTTPLRKVMNEPENKRKSSFKNLMTWATLNIKGRNWPNAIEETWREIQSAPMVLLFQSLFFATTRLHDPAKRSVLLSQQQLQDYQKAFASFVQHIPEPTLKELSNTPKGVRKLIGQFTHDLLAHHFKTFKNKPFELHYITENAPKTHYTWLESRFVNSGKKIKPNDYQTFLNWYLSHFKTLKGKPATYGTVLEVWLKDWNHALAQGAKHQNTTRLETIFGELTKNHNESIMSQLTNELGIKEIRAKGLPATTSKDLLEQLEKADDLIRFMLNRATQTYKTGNTFKSHLLSTSNKIIRALTLRKMWYSLSLFAIVTISYFASSIHAQSNNAYPANRLFHSNDIDSNKAPQYTGKPNLGNMLSQQIKMEAPQL